MFPRSPFACRLQHLLVRRPHVGAVHVLAALRRRAGGPDRAARHTQGAASGVPPRHATRVQVGHCGRGPRAGSEGRVRGQGPRAGTLTLDGCMCACAACRTVQVACRVVACAAQPPDGRAGALGQGLLLIRDHATANGAWPWVCDTPPWWAMLRFKGDRTRWGWRRVRGGDGREQRPSAEAMSPVPPWQQTQVANPLTTSYSRGPLPLALAPQRPGAAVLEPGPQRAALGIGDRVGHRVHAADHVDAAARHPATQT